MIGMMRDGGEKFTRGSGEPGCELVHGLVVGG